MTRPLGHFALPEVDRNHNARVQDMRASVSSKDLADAFLRCMSVNSLDPNRLTPTRHQWREFFRTAARLPSVSFTITYYKKHGELRHMLATIAGAGIGGFAKYVTLWDMEAEAYRQVNLDGIVKVTMETSTAIIGDPPPFVGK